MRLTPDQDTHKRETRVRLREFGLPMLAGLLLFLGGYLFLGGDAPYEEADTHSFPAFQTMELKVKGKGLWRLRTLREKALQDGVLMREPNDWVKGHLVEGQQEWPVRLRLKGDWTDHLQSGKWSFRVELRDTLAYHRLKVFSLQSPRTRSFLDEWYFHQVLLQEGIMTPRYDFVRLHFNGAELGIYALEEHFSKQMIEANGQRESAIYKFNEDGLWEARREALRDPDIPFVDLPLYEASHPEAFGYKDLLKKRELQSTLDQGQDLMHAYKYGLRPAEELFDLDRMARAYALIDLFRAHHALVWHNRRYYHEPITARLHPVIYDAYSGDVSGQYLNGPFTGYASNGRTYYDGRMDLLGTKFFAEESFVYAYYHYLHQYTSPEFLTHLESTFGGLRDRRRDFLRREYLFFQYKEGRLENAAEEMRGALKIDRELLEWDVEGGCLKNLNPVAVVVTVRDYDRRMNDSLNEEGWKTLQPQLPRGADVLGIMDAYDGRGLADHVSVPDSVESLTLAIPGSAEVVVLSKTH